MVQSAFFAAQEKILLIKTVSILFLFLEAIARKYCICNSFFRFWRQTECQRLQRLTASKIHIQNSKKIIEPNIFGKSSFCFCC